MSTKITLDYQIDRLGFWSAILLVASGVVSMFLPLDIPRIDGYGNKKYEAGPA